MQEKPNSPSSSASAKQPFSMTRADLGGLVHPTKSPEHLQSLGGCTQVLKALCVDPNVGIRAAPKMEKSGTIRGAKKDGAAQKPAPSQPPTQIVIDSQNPSEEERLLCFGPNRLPPARRITIFEYMLAALGDKIMILLSCVSMISLALGLYQDFGPQAEPTVAKIHWLEGFSILVAVILIVFAASMNDLQKEKKFRKLNDKKEDRYIK
ncbi:plasma membrane calcium, partial [Chytriomyces hyalinus]